MCGVLLAGWFVAAAAVLCCVVCACCVLACCLAAAAAAAVLCCVVFVATCRRFFNIVRYALFCYIALWERSRISHLVVVNKKKNKISITFLMTTGNY